MSGSDVEYALCDECGALVPEANMAIHQARACGARARAAPSSPAYTGGEDVIEIEGHNPPVIKRPSKSTNLSPNRQRPRIEKSSEEVADLIDGINDDLSHDSGIVGVGDVVDLTTSPPSNSVILEPAARVDNDEWSCPKCTLLNPKNQPRCDACNYVNPEMRPPDAMRSERLVDDFGFPVGANNNHNSVLLNLGGGALLGSLLGGATSYMRGRSVADGMVEGAVSGAVGGAIMDSMMRNPTRTSVTSARSGAAMGHPAYPSLTNTRAASRQAPRASFQVRQQRSGANGSMVTTVIRSNGTTRFAGEDDPLLALMMAMSGVGHAQHADVDTMNYEQLLQAFGDGTENMGAHESAIAQLPVTAINDPVRELPEDARQCCICLDDFCKGTQRKTLPCLHGFHAECIDRALRNRGCCPICNESVSS